MPYDGECFKTNNKNTFEYRAITAPNITNVQQVSDFCNLFLKNVEKNIYNECFFFKYGERSKYDKNFYKKEVM